MSELTKAQLLRQIEREKLARKETENILERVSLELYYTNQHLKSYLNDNELLLRQYKDAVDEGTIVSKTDSTGRITYVNDEFCKISKYSRSELIGKSHNIVRHSEVPAKTFKELWATIKSKRTWKGVIKNKAKDGSIYIVQATIKPILNSDDEIVEYIAIRQDITQSFNLQEEIINTQHEMLLRMGELAETRSKETGLHVQRVSEYSVLLAKLYGLSDEEVQLIKSASPMHDIGKISTPDAILLKPGKLTDDEFEQMKQHAENGHKIFAHSKRELLKAASIIAHQHHEKWDGSGYPQGLKGEEIHIFGRITALADVFDALCSKRVYKEAWSDEKILTLIKEESGRHFDPTLVELFLTHVDAFLEIREIFRDKDLLHTI